MKAGAGFGACMGEYRAMLSGTYREFEALIEVIFQSILEGKETLDLAQAMDRAASMEGFEDFGERASREPKMSEMR